MSAPSLAGGSSVPSGNGIAGSAAEVGSVGPAGLAGSSGPSGSAGSPGSSAPSASGGGAPRRRTVLGICAAVAVAAAVLVAVLAGAAPASQITAASPLVGRAAPPISGTRLGGAGRVSLAQMSGKWVLVNFAASWCVPCQQEIPQLRSFAAEGARTGDSTILTVAYDQSDLANLAALLAHSKASWPAVSAPSALVSYGIHGIPESYLIDPQGTVVEKITGGVNAPQLEQFIARFGGLTVPAAGPAGGPAAGPAGGPAVGPRGVPAARPAGTGGS
ncbi:MAG: TlpA family protein disulfide reductase [Acidimicrobiales bacterium]